MIFLISLSVILLLHNTHQNVTMERTELAEDNGCCIKWSLLLLLFFLLYPHILSFSSKITHDRSYLSYDIHDTFCSPHDEVGDVNVVCTSRIKAELSARPRPSLPITGKRHNVSTYIDTIVQKECVEVSLSAGTFGPSFDLIVLRSSFLFFFLLPVCQETPCAHRRLVCEMIMENCHGMVP